MSDVFNTLCAELKSYILIHASTGDVENISIKERETLTTAFILIELSKIIERLDLDNGGLV